MNTELLLRYIAGDCTDQEKEAITVWLDADPDNMREFLALRKLHDIAIWQTSETNLSVGPVEKISVRSGRRIFVEILKVAAVLLVAILVSRYILFPESTSENLLAMQSVYVPAGQRAELTLVDGTKVWLNAKTTFTFPNYFSESSRIVTLDGEGYFDVTSSKDKPFIVKTEKYDIKVLGTTFDVKAYSGKGIFQTSLLDGSVEVMKRGESKGLLMRPFEQATLDNDKLVLSSIGNMNYFLWKDGIISFKDESFTEMVKKLELYFDLEIEIKNDKILKYRCTGKFRTKEGVEHILKVLQLSNAFSFSIDDKKNKITIN